MNPTEDFCLLKVTRRHFSMAKVELVDMVDMADMVDNMVDDMIIVDSISMMNMQKTFCYK